HPFGQIQVLDPQGFQLAPTEPGQDGRLVDQGTFSTEQLQSLSNLGTDLGVTIAAPWPLSYRQSLLHRTLLGGLQEPAELLLIQGAALPASLSARRRDRAQDILAVSLGLQA